MPSERSGIRTIVGRAGILIWLCAAVCWPAGRLCIAQEGTPGKASPAQVAETTPEKRAAGTNAETVPSGRFDIKYLEGPDGRPVYVPDNVSLGQYLEWLEQRQARAGQGPPEASVSNLLFNGTADDERVYLTAIVD